MAGPGRRPRVVLRCPGPLVALRCLAALYGVSPWRLAACLAACEARPDADDRVGALATVVRDTLSATRLAPAVVHYFHATRLADPQVVLRHGLHPSIADSGRRAPRSATHHGATEPLASSATPHGPRGFLVRDVLLRPALYNASDSFTLAHPIAPDAREQRLRIDPAEPLTAPATLCIVEYRRPAQLDDNDVIAALWFVVAALHGTVSPTASAGHDRDGTPISSHDIVSIRALGCEREWAHTATAP